MQRLEFANKKTSNKQQVVSKKTNTVGEGLNKRESQGHNLALTKMVYRLENSDTYYIESESVKELYYFIRYKFDESNDYCTCPDSSIRRIKCKHQFAIEYSIKLATIKTVNKFEGKTFQNPVVKTYEEDDIYDY